MLEFEEKAKKTEVTRIVSKIGDSWVLILDPQTRGILGVKELGETVCLHKESRENEDNNEIVGRLEELEHRLDNIKDDNQRLQNIESDIIQLKERGQLSRAEVERVLEHLMRD